MSRAKKYLIIILLFLTTISVGFAVFLATQNQGGGDSDVSVSGTCTRWCAGGSCTFSNGDTFSFGDDTNSPQSSCQARIDEACRNKAAEISRASGRTITVSSQRGGEQLTCPTTGGGTSSGGTVNNGSSCITPGNNKSLGDECNKLCGDNACDGSGPLGCNTCISGTKMGKSVCSVGANNASYFTACGMTKLPDGQACTFNEQCQGFCVNGKCASSQSTACPLDLPAFGRNNTCPCSANNQCSSGRCSSGVCSVRIANDALGCTVNNDCQSLFCNNPTGETNKGTCKPPGQTFSCSNGIRDGQETGIDCGTACGNTCPTSGGGTSGGGTVTPSGTIPTGQACTPGSNQCVTGTFCTPNPQGQNVCNTCVDGIDGNVCGTAGCGAGGTCDKVIAFKCTGDFGEKCDLSDPGVQVFDQPGLTWPQAEALIGGCGQIDIVCSAGSRTNTLCGDFRIYRNSCGTGTTPPPPGDGGGNPPPGSLSCNSPCQNSFCSLNQAQCVSTPGASWCTNVNRCFPSSAAATVNCVAGQTNEAINQRIDAACSLGTCPSGLVCDTGGSRTCRLPSNITSPSCSPAVVATPFCGDAICQAGELCERAGTTGAAANEFRQCSNNQAVSSCRNLATSAPSLANGCTFCGDGVYQSGVEQCDASAPATGGNDPVNCNAQCQTVAPICVALTQNPTFVGDTMSSGVGNIVEYELTYQNASTTNPYPNIRLRVADPLAPTVAIGRDADNSTNALVAPAVAPTRNATNSTWTYRFRWESADTANVDVPDGTYDVRVLLDGTNATAIASPAGCLESITVDAAAAEEPIFTVVKQGALVCQTNNNARIDYTVTVTNVGPVAGSIDFVRDTLDPNVVALGITPTDIVPSFGTYSAGQITWVGTPADLAFTPGQVKVYTYAITIPAAQVTAFRTNGVNNTVQVQYDTGTTTDNVTEFDLTTPMTCSVIVIPVTSIFTDSTRFLLLGMIFMIGGYTVYRYRIGASQVQMILKSLTRPLNFEEMVLHDKKFRTENKKRK